MLEIIILLITGIVLITIGVLNRKGNLKMIHTYHYKRVSKKDINIFGKQVGLGTIIIGSSILINGILYAIYLYTKLELYILIAKTLLIIGFIIGIIIIFHAMFKYNKGIF